MFIPLVQTVWWQIIHVRYSRSEAHLCEFGKNFGDVAAREGRQSYSNHGKASLHGGATFTDLKKPFTSLIKHKSRCKVTSMVDESYTYPNY